ATRPGASSAEAPRTRLLKGVALGLQGQAAASLAQMAPFCSRAGPAAGPSQVQEDFFSLNCVGPLLAMGRVSAAIDLLSRALPVLRENLGGEAPTVGRAQQWLDSLRSTGALPPAATGPRVFFS